jgi:hypothetical protein
VDLLDLLFDSYAAGRLSGVSALQAQTDHRLTASTDRLSDLEFRYERLHMVTTALWLLLKEHTGLTDADLKQFVAQVEASRAKAPGAHGTMQCEKCGRIIKQAATRCIYCGSAVTKGDAFQGT